MNGAEIARPPVHRITLAQLALLVSLCLGVVAFDKVYAYSVLIGGLIAVVPQAYFAVLAFSAESSCPRGSRKVSGQCERGPSSLTYDHTCSQ